MRMRWLGCLLILALIGGGVPAFAVDRMPVIYVNGTVKAAAEDANATLDTSSGDALRLQVGAEQVAIPYANVTAYTYHVENRFRLGVLGTVAVGMLKARSKRHLMMLSWKDDSGTYQTATLEASKDRACGLIHV